MEIQCTYYAGLFIIIGRRYTCQLASQNVSKPSEVKSCIGVHLAERSDQDVEALWIENSVLHYLPSGFDRIFPRLVGIYIVHCGLKKISAKVLKGLEHLEVLCLANNHLTSVPNNLFIHTKRLIGIDFSENQIESMSSRIFDPIHRNQLEVNLIGNTNIDVYYASSEGMQKFEELKHAIDTACKIPKLEKEEEEEDVKEKIKKLKQSSSLGFEKLWKLEKFSDFTIVVGEKEFQVHKIVLAQQSSVFASMFETDEAVKTSNKLEIKDCSEVRVEEFLCAVYTGEIVAYDEHKRSALDLYSLACTFKIPELKALTETLVVRELDDENAVKALTVGHLYKSDKIIDAAFVRIRKSILEVDLSEALKNKPEHCDAVVRAIKGLKEAIDDLMQ